MKKTTTPPIMESLVPFHVHSEFLENIAYLSIGLIVVFFILEVIFVFDRAYVDFCNRDYYED